MRWETRLCHTRVGQHTLNFVPRSAACVSVWALHVSLSLCRLCVPICPGGAKVLDGIGKELLLDEPAMEPSRMVLHDYGNVSSSTTWYTLGYVESVRGAKKGDRLLQIGVGSGIKCGVNVWRAVRDIHDVQVGAMQRVLIFIRHVVLCTHMVRLLTTKI